MPETGVGKANKEIAAELAISRTARTHVSSILSTLGLTKQPRAS
jgi:DNA-binding NarL/FixJ family response regulator